MASSVETLKCSSHVRSISLPSRAHPLSLNIEEQLNRVRSSGAASTSSVSSASQKLQSLKDLYNCVDDLLHLPLTQQLLSHEHQRSSVEELLGGSMKLLEVCGNVKEFFSQIKECIQEVKSSFRRRKGGYSGMAGDIAAYTTAQKKLQKVISKFLVNLRKMEKKTCLNEETTLNLLREVKEISLSIFASLLCFIAQTSVSSRSSGWSRVSKLLSLKRVSCDGEEVANEMTKLDSELFSLISGKRDSVQVKEVAKRLETLESSIQEIEEDLECVYRRLVKIRVSLLNIVNH